MVELAGVMKFSVNCFRRVYPGRYPTKPIAMNPSPVYCALIEVKMLEGCEFDPRENAGAAVRCYIPAGDASRAMDMLNDELLGMRMELIETDWCVDYENTEWDKPGNPAELDLVSESRSTGDILFGAFQTWPHDAPDA